jgi:hypothetical protein
MEVIMGEKKTPLDVLFPKREVAIPIGSDETMTVEVEPLKLGDLPKVATAFGKLMKLASEGTDPSELASVALVELLTILPYCLPNHSVEELPSTAAPYLIEAVVELNITEDVMGKWMALAQKVIAFGTQTEADVKASQGQSEKSSTT